MTFNYDEADVKSEIYSHEYKPQKNRELKIELSSRT